jgi:hypothetical protein
MADEVKKKLKVGRKPMLNKPLEGTIKDAIVTFVKRGCSQKSAAAAVGVDVRTVEKWVAWGNDRQLEGAPSYEDRQMYRDFVKELELAREAREARWIQPIDLAALRGNVHAAQWLLRTKFPELYGDKIALEIKNSIDHILEVAERVLEASQFAKLAQALSSGEGEEVPFALTSGPAADDDPGRIH